jgi:hypothetical protein
MSGGEFGDHVVLLRRIHGYLLPRTYVEIGVHSGRSLAACRPETLAIGIDPLFSRLQLLDRTRKQFALTSDQFFERHDLGEVLGGKPLDLAFVDGMHLFEFALRDVMNLERWCRPNSVILIHDCYPIDRAMAARESNRGWWSGDVWKLILCLKRCRPDLRISVVDVLPSGLGIITNLDPASTVLQDNYEDICTEFVEMDYAELDDAKEAKLNRVSNAWDAVREALPPKPFSQASTSRAHSPSRA